MANRDLINCPLCGNKVPVSLSRCPVCATELKAQDAGVKEVRKRILKGELVREKLPEVSSKATKHSCPFCAMELSGSETKCPRCGVPLAGQQEMMLCPKCNALVAAGASSCPSCGLDFLEMLGILPPSEEVPEPVRLPEPYGAPARPSPETVTAVATTPPRPLSQGLVNGRGAINGTGFVNGTGMINGTRGEIRSSTATKRDRGMFVTRWQFLAVLVALIIVIPTFIYLSYSSEPSAILIDGDFDDWADMDKFGTYIPAASSAVNIDEWAVSVEANDLYIYFMAEGALMSTADVASFYMFVDSDNSAVTGYSISGMGADYMVGLDGWNGSVQASVLAEYPSSSLDHLDWNAWDRIGAASSAISGRALEAKVVLPLSVPNDARFLMISMDRLERSAVSLAVTCSGPVLVIEQQVGPGVSSDGLVGLSSNVALLRLKLLSEGGDASVQSIVPTVSGAVLTSSIGPVDLEAGVSQTVDVYVDTSSSVPGSLVSAGVAVSGVDADTSSNITVIGQPARAYISSAPSSIVIDGAFGDWEGRTTLDTDSVWMDNPDIDIDEVAAVNESTDSYFYVRVEGEMCGGSFVPVIKTLPSGGGGTVIPTKKTGEDILRIYVDADLSSSTGFGVSAGPKIIGADYRMEVKGLGGKIVSRSLSQYAGGQWNSVTAAIDAANDLHRIELSVTSAALGGSSSFDFIVQTTDWNSRLDVATAVPEPTRYYTGGMLSAISPDRWIVDGSSTSQYATSMSYQRKLFYDGTNFWSFYFDGTNTVYRYSTNGGVTWNAGGRPFVTNGVNEVSIWYDAANNLVYACGDTSASTVNLRVQRGAVNPAAHTITWSASDASLAASSFILGSKNSFISKDVNGYIWVISSNCTQTSPIGRYDLSAFRSASVDSISSWLYSGNMLNGDDLDPNIKGTIVPAGTGSDMWAIYTYSGNMASRKYTGAWSNEATIYLVGSHPGSDTDIRNTDIAPPSAVVDSNGVVHVVYGDSFNNGGQCKPRIYYAYNQGAGWTEERRDNVPNNIGNRHPTISIDSSTDNLYLFWVETDVPDNPLTIVGWKNASGTWTQISMGTQTTFQKHYLTSIYSVSGEQNICWQWTQNTTIPIDVIFDKIPEFADIALPVLIVIAVFFAVQRRRSAKPES